MFALTQVIGELVKVIFVSDFFSAVALSALAVGTIVFQVYEIVVLVMHYLSNGL